MILREVKKKGEKYLDSLAIGDILKRNTDRIHYDLKSISNAEQGFDNMLFHFFGFSIKGTKNLKEHFELDDTKRKFIIYE